MTTKPQPPVPPDEASRLERLMAYAVLDTPREALFDRYVFAAAQLFRTPFAVVSLVDSDRVWMKAKVGMLPQELPRVHSFCAYAILSSQPMVVEDASLDARFQQNPLVTDPPFLRFYAGAPLITSDGYAIGTISVADRQPRTPQPKQLWHLSQLAHSVMDGLEARRAALVS